MLEIWTPPASPNDQIPASYMKQQKNLIFQCKCEKDQIKSKIQTTFKDLKTRNVRRLRATIFNCLPGSCGVAILINSGTNDCKRQGQRVKEPVTVKAEETYHVIRRSPFKYLNHSSRSSGSTKIGQFNLVIGYVLQYIPYVHWHKNCKKFLRILLNADDRN